MKVTELWFSFEERWLEFDTQLSAFTRSQNKLYAVPEPVLIDLDVSHQSKRPMTHGSERSTQCLQRIARLQPSLSLTTG